MSARREIQTRLKTLHEISGIMGSMRNISLMETRRISRFLDSQRKAIESIEAAGADFLQSYGDFAALPFRSPGVCLLIGSERGFCGDFNTTLLRAFVESGEAAAQVIVMGRRLCMEFEGRYPQALLLQGAGVADEVPGILAGLVEALNRRQREQGTCCLTVFHHVDGEEKVRKTRMLPPFSAEGQRNVSFAFPPVLTLPPEQFFSELTQHYLFAALHAVFYESLMAEHQQRVRHLEGATRRLEGQIDDLSRKNNILRQEEITEEIEEIMLGSSGQHGRCA